MTNRHGKEGDYNLFKLKGRIVEKYGTLKRFAEEMGITSPYVTMLVKGTKPWSMKQKQKAMALLEISEEEQEVYFG